MFGLAFHAFLRIGEITILSAKAINHNLLQLEQVTFDNTSMSIKFVRYKHSKGEPLVLTVKASQEAPDCPVGIMKSYITLRGTAAGPLFLTAPHSPVTRAQFTKQLRYALNFCELSPEQFKSHSFRVGAATTAAAQGMSDSQIRLLGRWSADAYKKYIRCSQRLSAL